jgi:hypothetical protein
MILLTVQTMTYLHGDTITAPSEESSRTGTDAEDLCAPPSIEG